VEKIWNLSPVIANAHIRSLEFDDKGRLWIGTNIGHLLYMVDDSLYSDNMHVNNQIGSIEKLHWHEGKMYVGTSQGLFYSAEPDQKVSEIIYFRNKSITDIEPDDSGNIWVSTSNSGLIQMNEKDTINYTRATGLRENQINCLAIHKGALWIGLASSGYQIFYNNEFITPQQEKLRNQGIRSMHPDDNGMLWMGSNSAGLLLVSDAYIKSIPLQHDLSKKVILAIYGDDDGGKWVGSVGHGVYNIKGNEIQQYNQATGLSNNIVLSLTGKGDYIYAGTNLGLNRINKKTRQVDKKFSPGFQLDSSGITVLYKDLKGKIWIGVRYGGLYYINENDEIIKTNLPASVAKISLISAGE